MDSDARAQRIHTFGDSHAKFGFDRIVYPAIYCNNIGAKLCYSFVKCAQTKTMCLLTFTKLMRMMKAF